MRSPRTIESVPQARFSCFSSYMLRLTIPKLVNLTNKRFYHATASCMRTAINKLYIPMRYVYLLDIVGIHTH